ncbi:MAG TPA: zinc-dependent metalloprotease [Balneolales bacterium]|nr:zinc-dependent metalloprotease [Balneolales bacterium]
MKRLSVLSLFVCLLFATIAGTVPAKAQNLPSIAEKTKGMKKYPGYFDFYWDSTHGKIWMVVDKWNKEFLYMDALAAGVGSNDIGLDRSQLGPEHVVIFKRIGPKVLLVQKNLGYRAANTNNEEEILSVNEAFAKSVLYGFKVAAESGDKVLIDITDFMMQDPHHLVERLKKTRQGNYHVDKSRSAVYLPDTKNFPKNSELEVTLTLTGSGAGHFLRSVTPDPDYVTVRVHHSFVELPNDGYKPRVFDPRAGYFEINYKDYSSPISQSLVKRYIIRHNLVKKYPGKKLSVPVKPIIYYVDSGVPQPIRSALMEGASWWNKAFEAAGFKNAFQVKVLPKGVDPLDIRYNVINWVHRSTRGWSYGSSVVDPRTGEIIKANVLLGSLRVRQDYLIAQGLMAPFKNGVPSDKDNPMLKMALARIRQLAAHETGHTLGLAHNFASSYNDRASVMDYPQPYIKIGKNGKLDFSDAYAVGVGKWDIQAIKYGYTKFPKGTDVHKALNNIIESGIHNGLKYISDADARPAGSANPYAHLWDNGKLPYKELNRMLKVRQIALAQFGENNIKPGEPMATLQDVLVPIYLYHRYQVIATSKMLGGMDYTYAERGDGQMVTKIVSPDNQEAALAALLKTITPNVLALPESLIEKIAPRPPGYYDHRELFKGHTGVVFDPLGAAQTAAKMTVDLILNPERDTRLVEFHARDSKYPGLSDVIDKLIDSSWKTSRKTDYDGAIYRVVDNVVLSDLINLAENENTSTEVRAIADYKIKELAGWLKDHENSFTDTPQKAHVEFALSQIQQYEQHPAELKTSKPLNPPPGSPIGN